MLAVTFLSLEAKKDTEEYKLSYHYLISSETFAELDTDESKVRMNSYSYHKSQEEETVEFGFVVEGRSYRVVCHRKDGAWQVCNDCTTFD